MTQDEHKAKFADTVAILVKAYLNNQLEHKVCTACAVGNIIAHHLGTKPKVINASTLHECWEYDNGQTAHWWTGGIGGHWSTEQQRLTGYTVDEINRIEIAFECAEGMPDFSTGMSQDKTMDETWMFNGLMAVVDVLASIHGIDLKQTEEAKQLFVKV